MAPQQKETLGARLRQFRERDGVSLRDVARKAGLNSGYLSQLERNDVAQPTPAVLHKVSRAYGVDFPVLMRWAGYIEEDERQLSPNQALALRVLGDPTNEEIQALKQILSVLRSSGRATMTLRQSITDRALDPETRKEIHDHARAILKEIDCYGRLPTPLTDVQRAVGLIAAGELELSVSEQRHFVKEFGTWIAHAWDSLLGSVDFRRNEVWVKEGQHPSRARWVHAHELGHALLPWQRDTFEYLIDSRESLSPTVAAGFEREANEAAAQLLFQGDVLRDYADSSIISIEAIEHLSTLCHASLVATARYVAESSKHEVAAAIAHISEGRLNRTHLYCSANFDRRFGWSTSAADAIIRPTLRKAPTVQMTTEVDALARDGSSRTLRVGTLNTSYSVIAIIVPEPVFKRSLPRLWRATPVLVARS